MIEFDIKGVDKSMKLLQFAPFLILHLLCGTSSLKLEPSEMEPYHVAEDRILCSERINQGFTNFYIPVPLNKWTASCVHYMSAKNSE
jgi:hypothetical protein